MSSAIDFSQKSLIFITGASRGIGRAIAVETSHIVNPESAFVLIASSASGLEETKSLIKQVNSSLNVITYPLDLSVPSSDVYEKLFDEVLKKIDINHTEHCIFIHNAGTIGILKKSLDVNDVDIWKNYYDLNVISAVILNTIFVKKVRNLFKKLIVINMTSLCGRVPFVNMSMYGSGKAARELFFKVFALEEPDILVLNYSPGPVDTDMFDSIVDTAQDEGLRKTMKESTVLKPEQTVQMLLGILKKGDFKSGDTIDYFDRV
ncbi:hypothetical protein WA026_000222 [Henosepilachna vigintioctopunctata]|uniref:Sepiapterin reductase n=1 Tax=Henosepilachna vigintioctopunctata TaxID=420089 RepID=A0AAW1UZR1_9CUCU|nr:sepiapterin reductase [Henosepilachna vigintioctopunctata]